MQFALIDQEVQTSPWRVDRVMRILGVSLPWFMVVGFSLSSISFLRDKLETGEHAEAARDLPQVALLSGVATLAICLWVALGVVSALAINVDKALENRMAVSPRHNRVTLLVTSMTFATAMASGCAFGVAATPMYVKGILLAVAIAMYAYATRSIRIDVSSVVLRLVGVAVLAGISLIA